MKRLVWGIILITVAVFAFMGALTNRDRPENTGGALLVCAAMAVGGIALVVFSVKAADRTQLIMETAFGLWRRDGRMESVEIARCCGLPVTTVREVLIREQVSGILTAEVPVDVPRMTSATAGGEQ